MNFSVMSQGFEYGVKHFLSPESGSAVEIITKVLEIDLEQTIALFDLGSIYINSQRANKDYVADFNDHIRVHTKPRRYEVNFDWSARIVFENTDFLILNKPSGIPSHPSVDNQIENSLTQVEMAIQRELFITHRLDTLTEGLIVYAKNKNFVNHFNFQLQHKTISKKYVALVETTKKINQPHLVHYMERTPRSPKNLSSIFKDKWDICELIIEDQKILKNYSWVKINLLTGRTHQIRSQLSFENAPIIGDKLYGSQIEIVNKIKLKAQEIEFNSGSQRFNFKLDENFEIDF